MSQPAPRTLTEKQQRAALAGGNPRTAARLRQIETQCELLHQTVAEILGKSRRQADRIGVGANQPQVRIQTSGPESGSQMDGYDWIESAPSILARLRLQLREELLG